MPLIRPQYQLVIPSSCPFRCPCLANSTTNRRQVSDKLTFTSFESSCAVVNFLFFFSYHSLSERLRLKNISYILKYILYRAEIDRRQCPRQLLRVHDELPLPLPSSSFSSCRFSPLRIPIHIPIRMPLSQLVSHSNWLIQRSTASFLLSPCGSILTLTRLRRKCHALRLHFDLQRGPHADYNKVLLSWLVLIPSKLGKPLK